MSMRRWALASLFFVAVGFIFLAAYGVSTIIITEVFTSLNTSAAVEMSAANYNNWSNEVGILRDMFGFTSVFFFIFAGVAYFIDAGREEHERY